jgi:hypothetical protein
VVGAGGRPRAAFPLHRPLQSPKKTISLARLRRAPLPRALGLVAWRVMEPRSLRSPALGDRASKITFGQFGSLDPLTLDP